MKRVVFIVVGLMVLIGGFFFFRSRTESTKRSTITTTSVKRADFVKNVSSSGKTSATKSVDLKFQTSGKLAWVGVKEGDEVAAFRAIAGLDDYGYGRGHRHEPRAARRHDVGKQV